MVPSSSPTSGSILQNVSDRRRAPRARLGVAVTITVAGRLIDAMGGDLSPGGIRILAAESARVGDGVSLVFFLNGDIVSARGTVCWCAPARRGLATFGVRFTAVEEDGPTLVASYCRSSLC
jgi:hypothetical protein